MWRRKEGISSLAKVFAPEQGEQKTARHAGKSDKTHGQALFDCNAIPELWG